MPKRPEPLIANARTLRRQATEAEQLLWRHLRSRQMDGLKFRRQHAIGPYIADLVCDEAMLIVEADGGQHAEHVQEDAARTVWLEAQGYKVFRFWNNERLQNTSAVLEEIRRVALLRQGCVSPHPHPHPLPRGEME